MIKANHKKFWVTFARYYSKFLLKFFFRNIKYVGEFEKTDLPVLMIGNHFSWWDGFIQIQLNNAMYHRKFHFMMLENELKKSEILTTIGAFSISKGKRSAVESLVYASNLLKEKENMLLFFPQGRIQSIYTNHFKFEKGLLSHILKNNTEPFQFVFNVNLFDYNNKRRPEITVYHKSYNLKSTTTVEQIEADYNTYAMECIETQRAK